MITTDYRDEIQNRIDNLKWDIQDIKTRNFDEYHCVQFDDAIDDYPEESLISGDVLWPSDILKQRDFDKYLELLSEYFDSFLDGLNKELENEIDNLNWLNNQEFTD